MADLGSPLAMSTNNDQNGGYAIVDPDEARDHYAGSDVPGEFRTLTDALGCSQLAITLIRVPPHSDFEQGTGHFHDEIEELYLVTAGALMMFGGTIDASGMYAPPKSSGRHSIRASSNADTSQTAVSFAYVTNYGGTYTYHNDN